MQALLKRKESDIKRAIIQYLRLRGHLVIPYRTTGIKTANKGWIPAVRTGISDILGVTKEGLFFAVETKRPGNRPTPEQIQFLEQVSAYRSIALVAYSIEDVIAAGL